MSASGERECVTPSLFLAFLSLGVLSAKIGQLSPTDLQKVDTKNKEKETFCKCTSSSSTESRKGCKGKRSNLRWLKVYTLPQFSFLSVYTTKKRIREGAKKIYRRAPSLVRIFVSVIEFLLLRSPRALMTSRKQKDKQQKPSKQVICSKSLNIYILPLMTPILRTKRKISKVLQYYQ